MDDGGLKDQETVVAYHEIVGMPNHERTKHHYHLCVSKTLSLSMT